MNRLKLMQNIAKYIAVLSAQLEILNSNNEVSINIHAESVFLEVLNIVYDLNLRNLNSTDKGNFAAIDLLDDSNPKRKVAFQITSTTSIDKIKDSIEKYFRQGVYKIADELNIYFLTSKQHSYSQKAIDAKINSEIKLLIGNEVIKQPADLSFSFTNANIFDHISVYRKLNQDNNLDKIIAVEQCLKRQYERVEQITNLGPYYNRLKNMIYEVVMEDEYGMTLKDIYTEPSLSILSTAFHTNDERFGKGKRHKFVSVDNRYKIHEFLSDIFNGDNFLKFKHSYRFVLMLGYPGQGKSSFCKTMLNMYIAADQHNKKPVFYFQLRNIRKAADFIFNPLSVLYDEACEQTEEVLERFTFNKSIMVLDGLDELYMRENLKLDDIDRLCIELARAIERYPELQILLTSRYGYVNDDKLARESILILQLSQFDKALQKEWLSKFKLFHPETWMTEDKIDLFNSDKKYKHIRELIEQPLLLHMVASIKHEIDENTNRAMVYEKLFSELIERRYAKEGQLEILQNVSEEDLRALIREIAFSIYTSGNEYITKTNLLKLDSSKKYLRRFPQQSLADSIKGIMISFYFKEVEKNNDDDFLEDRHNYAIEFLHKSLREYMTAEKIFFTVAEAFLKRRQNGRYILEDSKEALKVINYLFGRMGITAEVREHLEGIVRNAKYIDRHELIERLVFFLNDFIECDFYSESSSNEHPQVIDYCINSFYGYWYFISCLGPDRNYLINENIKYRVVDYLGIISSKVGIGVFQLDFSFQDFSYTHFNGIGFTSGVFNHSIFVNCGFSKCNFDGCVFEKTNMTDTTFFYSSFIESNVMLSDFSGSRWEKMELLNTEFHTTDFTGAYITDLFVDNGQAIRSYAFHECIFEDVEMDGLSYKAMKLWVPEIIQWNIRSEISNYSTEESNDNITKEITQDEKTDAVPENYKRIIL